jgi:hypothetical protein
VNRNYSYGSFLWNLGIRIRKIRIGFKSIATISSIGVFRVHQEILVDHDWILFNAMTFIFSLCGRERASQASFSSFLSLAWPTPFPGKCNVFHSNCARAAGGL